MICNFNPSLLVMLLLMLPNIGASHNSGCSEFRCGHHGPPIRFPFRIKDQEPDYCGYPGFDITCSHNHETMLELSASPVPIKFRVNYIDYQYQYVSISDPENCLPKQFLKLNRSSNSPFIFKWSNSDNISVSFFSCPPNQYSCSIYAYDWWTLLRPADSGLFYCTKRTDIIVSTNIMSTYGLGYELQSNDLLLMWLKPNCTKCEASGKWCKLKNNRTDDATECFDRDSKPISKKLLAAVGVILGFIVLVLVVIAIVQIYGYFKMKGEDKARVEKFLDDYRALKPTRFSYADIKRITNHFKVKLGEGAHGAVFKGKLSNEISVAVKILNNTEGDGNEFINEVGAMARIHHVNVVRMLGFCADGFHRALVYAFFPHGSLQKFICSPDDKDHFLGWEMLQHIALGIARGIEYLHQGCDQRILHFDINPHNVLLDDGFTPKITDFGLAKLCSKNQSTVSMTAARGTLGYIAPEVFSRNFGNVSYKSDIYSYGILLLEMVGGKKNVDKSVEENFQVLYPEWIHNLLERGDTRIHLEDEKDIKIAKKLAIVGLCCIQWHPVNRPSMKVVVQMLEGEGDKLTMPPTPFDSGNSMSTSPIIPERPLNLKLEVIPE